MRTINYKQFSVTKNPHLKVPRHFKILLIGYFYIYNNLLFTFDRINYTVVSRKLNIIIDLRFEAVCIKSWENIQRVTLNWNRNTRGRVRIFKPVRFSSYSSDSFRWAHHNRQYISICSSPLTNGVLSQSFTLKKIIKKKIISDNLMYTYITSFILLLQQIYYFILI